MQNEHAEYFSPEAIAEAAHALWYCRLHSKCPMWRGIAPAVRDGLDGAASIHNAHFQMRRLEALTREILERWPHLEPQVIAALERASSKR